jgi:hypothetical protein
MQMAKAAKKQDEPPLPRRQPYRKLKTEATPLARAVSTPKPTVSNVVSINKIPNKVRADFTSDTDWELYKQFKRLQDEDLQAKVSLLRELKTAPVELVEVNPAPVPAAGSVPVTLDESRELAAYLAHHNPMGYKIPTVKGTVILTDGTVLHVNKRQDFIDPGEPYLPYGGFQFDGLCFVLSEDREADKRHGEYLTARSQNTRERLGKTGKTAHENLVMVQEYRPVPDVLWFLQNPDGKSRLRGDLNPYPPGIVPVGKREWMEYSKAKAEHQARVDEWLASQINAANGDVYSQKFSQMKAKQAAAVMSCEPTDEQVSAHIRLDMMSHDSFDLMLMVERERNKADALPWSYAANDSDQVSEPQRSDASEGIPEVSPSVVAEYRADRARGNRWIPRPIQYAPTGTQQEPERDAEDPVATEDVVFVRSDGVAFKTSAKPEHFERVAEAVSTMQPHAGVTIAEGEDGKRMTVDLSDRRSLPALRILQRRLNSDLDDLLGHLETINDAIMQAEHYRSTGEFFVPTKDVTPAPTGGVRAMVLEDLYAKPSSVGRMGIGYGAASTSPWPRNTTKFIEFSFRADELARANDGRLRAWLRAQRAAYKEATRRLGIERKALDHYKKTKPRRVRRERDALVHIGEKIRGKNLLKLDTHLRQMKALESHIGEARARIVDERLFLAGLSKRNGPRMKRHMLWRAKEALRKAKGSAARKLNLTKKKARTTKVAPLVSTVSETPVNQPVVTMMPARTPPAQPPQQEPVYSVVLPKREILTYGNDPVLAAIRRSHYERLAKSGQFKEDELKAADQRAFQPLVA